MRSVLFFRVLLALSLAAVAVLLMGFSPPPSPAFQFPEVTSATPPPPPETPAVTPTGEMTPVGETPSPTPSPPSPTPSPPSPTPLPPSPSPTEISTPVPPTVPPSPPPSPTPRATPTISGPMGLVQSLAPFWPLIGAGCTGLLILLLLVLVGVSLFRRRSQLRKPTRPLPSIPPTPPSLEATLAGRPRRWPLEKESLTVGRAPDNDLVITAEFTGWETVSRRHARLYRWGDNWVVEDLDSTNGIYVNGRRTRRNLLRDGWELRIGSVAFVFRAGKGGVV